jgi:hypothetical protein
VTQWKKLGNALAKFHFQRTPVLSEDGDDTVVQKQSWKSQSNISFTCDI